MGTARYNPLNNEVSFPASAVDPQDGTAKTFMLTAVTLMSSDGDEIATGTNGLRVQGAVAAGVVAAGNPVPVGGVVTATNPTLSATQRAEANFSDGGGLRIHLGGVMQTASDGRSNGDVVFPTSTSAGVNAVTPRTGIGVVNYVFNGTTWDRQRGDTNGSYAVGNVASGVADAGNPVKVGARYNATLPTLTDGQRGDLQVDARGGLIVTVKGTGTTPAQVGILADGQGASNSLFVANQGGLFNGSTWDREKKPNLVARLLSAAASVNNTLVKNAAGDLFRIEGYNNKASAVFLKLYNKSTTPAAGTDVPIYTVRLAPTANFLIEFPTPLYFSAGIGYAITTAAADADTGALVAGDIVAMNVVYA